jgi:hypothetical protein
MEDQMANPKPESLVLTAEHNVVSPNGQIKLTAAITADERTAITNKVGKIEFALLSPADADDPIPNPDEIGVATWKAVAKKGQRLNVGLHIIRAEVWDGKSVRCGTVKVYVLNSTELTIVANQVNQVNQTCMQAGCPVKLDVHLDKPDPEDTLRAANLRISWQGAGTILSDPKSLLSATWDTTNASAGAYTITGSLVGGDDAVLRTFKGPMAGSVQTQLLPRAIAPGDTLRVALQRSTPVPTPDMGLWAAIRAHEKAISFGGIGVKGPGRVLRGYQGFIEQVLCEGKPVIPDRPDGDPCGPSPELKHIFTRAKQLPMHGMAAYELLKTATEIFLLWNCGVAVRTSDAWGNPVTTREEESARTGLPVGEVIATLTSFLGTHRLPYIERVVGTAFPGYVSSNSVFCTNVLTPRVDCVCLIELIWSYWHEEGMLVQAMNAISQRFQNVRGFGDRDPLAHVTIDPLRPLNNLLWGYVQDEQNRLTVMRRAAEYDHEYGITLRGKAVPSMRPADSRSKFLEGFHNLLHKCSVFYKEDNDTTVIADGFPLLNALKEVHLLLAQGAHNQFGDLPWTARVEMLVQQWLLARPEMRDFLQSRPMVPYTEAWMPQADTMKTLQGWSDVTVTHFHDLATFGEQIVLSIRYGDWIGINDENNAKNWARYWRPEIQSYIHAYRTVTGIDLTNPDTVDYTMPALHLQKRLAMQRAR